MRKNATILTLGCLSLVTLFGVTPSNSFSADNWLRFRGPSGSGVSEAANIPTKWGEDQNLAWKLKMPGSGFASPIVVGDKVLVTCYSNEGANNTRKLVCVDRQQGKILWEKSFKRDGNESGGAGFAVTHGWASQSPVSDGESVYVLLGNNGVIAFDLDGKQLWQTDVGDNNAAMFGSAISPILYKDNLIVIAAAESQTVYSLNKKTGKVNWDVYAGSLNRTYCTPLIAKNKKGEDELVISVANEVWGLDPDSGDFKWYASTRVDTNACPLMIADDGVVYVIGGRSGGRAAIRLGGKDDVTESHVLWSERGGSYVPSPLLHKGHLYWIEDKGIAYCVDVKTGEAVTQKRLGGDYYASILLINDKIYAVSRFEGTKVFEATPEFKEVASNKLNDESDFSATPAVVDGQLIIRSEKFLYCIENKEQ